MDSITLNLNDPELDAEGLSFDLKVSMLRSDTVKQFKEKVAKRINLPLESFYLVRNGNNKELKEMSRSLVSLGLTSGTMIKI